MKYINDVGVEPEIIAQAISANEVEFLKRDERGVGWYRSLIHAVPRVPKVIHGAPGGVVNFSGDEETLIASDAADDFDFDDDDDEDDDADD